MTFKRIDNSSRRLETFTLKQHVSRTRLLEYKDLYFENCRSDVCSSRAFILKSARRAAMFFRARASRSTSAISVRQQAFSEEKSRDLNRI